LAASLAWLALAHSPLPQLANALVLAFAVVQLGLAAHDVTHRQVLRGKCASDALGCFLWNLGCGLSLAWWRDKHSRHHRHPNERGRDPDLYAVFAFDREEAARRSGTLRLIARHQAAAFPLLVACTAAYFQVLSLAFLVRRRPRGWGLELALLAVRHAAFLGLVFVALEPGFGAAFLALHYAATGWYLGGVFATNHYGLPVHDAPGGDRTLHVTRNVRTGWLGDYLFGGLNYQIEHHLYPSLPRFALRRVSAQVRARSTRLGLPYHETGWAQALRAVMRDFHGVGRNLRRAARAA
jgi:fatty acid desaturase